jgi:hypothetical protein
MFFKPHVFVPNEEMRAGKSGYAEVRILFIPVQLSVLSDIYLGYKCNSHGKMVLSAQRLIAISYFLTPALGRLLSYMVNSSDHDPTGLAEPMGRTVRRGLRSCNGTAIANRGTI